MYRGVAEWRRRFICSTPLWPFVYNATGLQSGLRLWPHGCLALEMEMEAPKSVGERQLLAPKGRFFKSLHRRAILCWTSPFWKLALLGKLVVTILPITSHKGGPITLFITIGSGDYLAGFFYWFPLPTKEITPTFPPKQSFSLTFLIKFPPSETNSTEEIQPHQKWLQHFRARHLLNYNGKLVVWIMKGIGILRGTPIRIQNHQFTINLPLENFSSGSWGEKTKNSNNNLESPSRPLNTWSFFPKKTYVPWSKVAILGINSSHL